MQRQDLSVYPIPYIPSLVDIADVVHTAGRLVPADLVPAVKAEIADGNDRKYLQSILGTAFSVAKVGEKYFAIYKGQKHAKLLGKGAYGAVKLVQDIDDGSWAVMKTILKQNGNSTDSHNQTVAAEITNLKLANQFIGHYQRESASKGLQDVIFMPLAPGVTVKSIIKHRDMPAVKWLDLCLAMVRAAKELNDGGMVHRDIKPDNMIYDTVAGRLTLIDFGLARLLHPQTKSYRGGYAGSQRYMAPEISKRNKKRRDYNAQTEVYALGVSLLECFHLEILHGRVERTVALAERVRNPFLQDQICQLVEAMLHRNPHRRPPFTVIIERLETLRSCELDIASKINSLAYLSVEDYLRATPLQKRNVMNALGKVDEVYLCAQHDMHDQALWMMLKHDLESNGVCVLPEFITFGTGEIDLMMQLLRDYSHTRGAAKNIIYSGYYVQATKSSDIDALGMMSRKIDRFRITAHHKEMVLRNICAQIERIREKNPQDNRLQLLREFRYGLMHDHVQTYRQLFSCLETLQVDLLELELKSRPLRLVRQFGVYSTVTIKVSETSRELHNDIHGLSRKSSASPRNK